MTPKIGDKIYVPTSLYLSHGRDDFQGGICTVSKVKNELSAGESCAFVSVVERPEYSYNWSQYLAGMQDELRERYGDQVGHPDPDYHPSANEW